MFSLHNILGNKPDHPMFSVEEAKYLLADLPQNDPLKALDEITAWLTTIKDATGFKPERRADVIMLLDETGQALYAQLLNQYLATPHLQDFQGMHLWRGLQNFMLALADAYAACTQNFQQEDKVPLAFRAQMPLICVRLLRAVAEQMKLQLMRYEDVEPAVWQQLYEHYSFAKANQFAYTPVIAYPAEAIQIGPHKELLRALVLYISSTDTLAPNHIEASYHIAIRLVSQFELKEVRDADCTHFIDLALPEAPRQLYDELPSTPTMRFFGATKALPKVADIIHQYEHGIAGQDMRFSSEFTPDGKLTVLKHLRRYWAKTLPHRLHERKTIMNTIDVVHGFNAIGQLVTGIDLNKLLNLSEEDAAMLQKRSAVILAGEDVQHATETWDVLNVSSSGLGGVLPKTAGAWIKIGDLCGIRAKGRDSWWVGTIRRLKTDAQGQVQFGMEILSRKPLSLWLRSLAKGQGKDKGKDVELLPDWEASSGSFAYNYLPALLLPDDQDSYLNATLLIESGKFVTNHIHEALVGEQSRTIKLTGLLAEGEDYEQASLEWIDPVH